ncbi:extracellular catalytic domain type 1 short-chain-length polyhydroxyalkanoate depolymerase [Imhoffiella purpurea]|uniref:Poly(3-hydroxybutyrate) depolymerase n=1 Tax=Imhoffiella purpurea TaxID=1249627 RepID=W9VGV3_9GAMM|nr:PHB depolymerase family esterase [Imhoffiella purpurea]EXJ16251.1 Poly(3-hydroxybutyrate) depolymerase [Imhoffiella purpurea]
MKDTWKAVVREAVRLTRAGRIGEATGLVADTLAASSPEPRSGSDSGRAGVRGDAIEGEFEVVRDPGHPDPSASDEAGAAEWSWQSFENDSGARDYRLFVPPSRSGASSGRPLVTMLHGCGQDPDDFATSTRMNALAAQLGCCVLYPAQSISANASRCWVWYEESNQHAGLGEPNIIVGMVRHVIRAHAIDPRRVYVAGLSAGGAMAAILAALYPGLFAAVGIHSGLPHGAAHDLMSALIAMRQGALAGDASGVGSGISIPMIVFHGDADTTVNPVNAARLIAQAGFDVGGVGASGVEYGRAPGGCGYRRSTFVDGDGVCRAELWSVEDVGHGWSGGSGSTLFSEPCGPDASREMLRFFLEHPRV